MKKQLLLLLLMLLPNAFGLCLAQDEVQGVIVELSSGKKLEYRLTDNPRMKYDGQTITITGDGVNVQYSPSEIAKVKMGEVDVPTSDSENDSQQAQQGVIVELSNGERLEYGWADNPKIQYDGQTITISSESLSVEYTPSEIAKVRFGELNAINNSIEKPSSRPQDGDFTIETGFIRLSGFDEDDIVRAYTMDGKQFATYNIGPNGELLISVSSLPQGISILKIQQQTIKIARR